MLITDHVKTVDRLDRTFFHLFKMYEKGDLSSIKHTSGGQRSKDRFENDHDGFPQQNVA